MTVSLANTGVFHNVFNAANTAVAKPFVTGTGLVLVSGEYMGADATPSTPASWTKLSPGVNANQIAAWGFTSVTGSEAIPPITWGNQTSWAIVLNWLGLMAMATAVDSAGTGDRVSTTTTNIVGPTSAKVPSQSGSLVLLVGQKDKLAASNTTTFTAPSGFTMLAQQTLSGTSLAVCLAYQIQTAIATIPGNLSFVGSAADGSAQSMQGVLITLKPAIATFAPPPPQRNQRVHHTLYYPD